MVTGAVGFAVVGVSAAARIEHLFSTYCVLGTIIRLYIYEFILSHLHHKCIFFITILKVMNLGHRMIMMEHLAQDW